MSRQAHRTVLTVAVMVHVAACGTDAPTDGATGFIALGHDFEGFMAWPSITVDSDGQSGGHGAGPTRVYLNGRVPGPGIGFDVGTILVKGTPAATYPEWEVHAMAKRGAGFNPDGAVGWEWFDLALDASGAVAIAWRGAGTPFDPGSYGVSVDGGGAMMSCSQCHAAVSPDDYVFTRFALGTID